MLFQTTDFGQFLHAVMLDMLKMGCIEKSNRNDGLCVSEIVKEYDNNIPLIVRNRLAKYQKSGKQLSYCAIFVNVVIDIAIKRFCTERNIPAIINPLRLGMQNIAFTKTLLSEAKKVGLRIDKNPAPGAIFFNPSGSGAGEGSSSGYHVGMVLYVNEAKKAIGTCEGNTSGYLLGEDDCLKKAPKNGIVTKERPAKKVKYYIHIEEYFGTDKTATINFMHSGLSGLGSGEYCVLDMPIDETDDKSPDDDPGIANNYSGNNNDIVKYLIVGALGIAAIYYAVKVK